MISDLVQKKKKKTGLKAPQLLVTLCRRRREGGGSWERKAAGGFSSRGSLKQRENPITVPFHQDLDATASEGKAAALNAEGGKQIQRYLSLEEETAATTLEACGR